MTIGVFPCGTEIGLEIGRSLRFEKGVQLVGLSSVECHGRHLFDRYDNTLPFITADHFISELNNACERHGITHLMPANDAVLCLFAECGNRINAAIISHPNETVRVCGDKSHTYNALKDVVRVPEGYCNTDPELLPFPLFLKPAIGHSGIGCHVVNSLDELNAKYDPATHMILELLTGEEYTVDCFTSLGELVYCAPRTRKGVTNGISCDSHAVPFQDAEFRAFAEAISSKLSFTGAWFFQVKRAVNGELCLLEVAARIAGSSGLSRARGVNLSLMNLHEYRGERVTVNPSHLPASVSRKLDVRATLPHFKGRVWVDFDDTLIVNGKVNGLLLAFLYKNSQNGVNVITRSIENIESKMYDLCIPRTLFDDIIQISPEDRKSDFITDDDLLIDDSFSERKGVKFALSPSQIDLFT
jgi:predicted ATP-grasp superfamily ATP-dependent carboligase